MLCPSYHRPPFSSSKCTASTPILSGHFWLTLLCLFQNSETALVLYNIHIPFRTPAHLSSEEGPNLHAPPLRGVTTTFPLSSLHRPSSWPPPLCRSCCGAGGRCARRTLPSSGKNAGLLQLAASGGRWRELQDETCRLARRANPGSS